MNNHLLPIGSTTFERNLSLIFSAITQLDIPITSLWSAELCQDSHLAWLAWSLNTDEWSHDWSNETKRQAISQSHYIHRHKGTIASIRRVLKASGFGDAEILENLNAHFYSGNIIYNENMVYGGSDSHWATYRIVLTRPISNEQAKEVRKLLEQTAPARCHLAGLHFEQANLYNHQFVHNGKFSYGVA
ncbi:MULTISPECIES: phage tail protein I [Rodentibacter]|uniref:phage tail protein I n=1 Tax=Rodentibacter TaxID=1960084 RepID=UPI001CFEC3DA|nr:phage tail protein I [Rodentibacter sp. JRC1]GJI55898.1 tail fiber protein [Rodentibacter sp. JRC1]